MTLNIQEELKAAKKQLMRTCQHPKAQRGVCDRVIAAHSVPRAALARFAQDGHVVQINHSDPTAALRGESVGLEARPRGINEASTLPIFCAKHDSSTFARIENGMISADASSGLLFHYRGAVRRWVNSEYLRRGFERVWTKTQALSELLGRAIRSQIAHEVLDSVRDCARAESYKRYCDELLETGTTNGLRAVFVEFDELPHFMCCGSFEPLFDFSGRSLQELAHPLTRIAASLDPVVLTVIGTEGGGGLAVLSSVGFGLAAGRFIESFLSLPEGDKADAITRLTYNLVENVYFAPSWWNAMGTDAQSEFVARANDRYGQRLPDDVVAPREPRLATWAVISTTHIDESS